LCSANEAPALQGRELTADIGRPIRQEFRMGLLSDKWEAQLGGHTIEVRANNRVWRGLIYSLFFDGREVATAQNFWKIPTRRRLEARVAVDGAERHLAVGVRQRWLSAEFALTIDGEPVPLNKVG
jgi:hypothetical protein